MASRSLNKVELIGNLTRDPELRYTPSGTPVCTFSLATNRQWVTENGEKKEDVEFHKLVAWQKLAEICGKFLTKGRKVWIQGRLQTRSWTGQDNQQRQTTEIVIEDMIILDAPRTGGEVEVSKPQPSEEVKAAPKKRTKKVEEESQAQEEPVDIKEEVRPDEIPF